MCCSPDFRQWRCRVDGGAAYIEHRRDDGVWVVRANIPLDEAVGIAKELMAARKMGLAHEAIAAMEAG